MKESLNDIINEAICEVIGSVGSSGRAELDMVIDREAERMANKILGIKDSEECNDTSEENEGSVEEKPVEKPVEEKKDEKAVKKDADSKVKKPTKKQAKPVKTAKYSNIKDEDMKSQMYKDYIACIKSENPVSAFNDMRSEVRKEVVACINSEQLREIIKGPEVNGKIAPKLDDMFKEYEIYSLCDKIKDALSQLDGNDCIEPLSGAIRIVRARLHDMQWLPAKVVKCACPSLDMFFADCVKIDDLLDKAKLILSIFKEIEDLNEKG